MAELVRLLVELLERLNPFRIVWTWQRGVRFFCGKATRVVGPGLKVVWPLLGDIRLVNITPEPHPLPMANITLKDGSTLSYSAVITLVVSDPLLAYTRVAEWEESGLEEAAGVLSDELARCEVRRLDPERGKRDNVIEECRKSINEAIAEYGLSVAKITMPNFVRNIRLVRLILDKAVMEERKL